MCPTGCAIGRLWIHRMWTTRGTRRGFRASTLCWPRWDRWWKRHRITNPPRRYPTITGSNCTRADPPPLAGRRFDGLGEQGNRAAAPGRVDDVVGPRQPAGPPPQRLHNLETLLHGRSEVFGPRHLVALVDVVRPHPSDEQLLHQSLHYRRIVVNPLQ